MSSRDQIRAEIGRRLREHYDEAASRTIPDRLARLIDKIGESESESGSEPLRDGEHSSEQARRESEECAGVRALPATEDQRPLGLGGSRCGTQGC
jgi:hypothetical protein